MKPVHNRQTSLKKLIFIRHGKAEDQTTDLPDFERSLTRKGKDQCRIVAQRLKSHEKDLGLVVTSPAFRAIETAMIFGKEFGMNLDSIKISSDLYFDLDTDAFASFVKKQGDGTGTITMFGHNYLISEMAAFFAADSTEILPKAGVLCLSFEADNWSSVKKAGGKVTYFLSPKSPL